MDQGDALGETLRELRTRAGLSQEDLASAAGVSAEAISDLERSVTRSPRAKTARGIADALGLTGEDRSTWLSLATPPAGRAAAPTALAKAVRDLRRQRDISPRELGRRAGLDVRSIRDIEAGRRTRIHPRNAVKLADEFGLNGDDRERFLRLAAGGPAGELVTPEVTRSPEFCGRERELAEVADLLLRHPLVVLTGPGGVGKTALAEVVLAGLDRPHLVLDLTRVPAGEDLAHAITMVCRFDEHTDAGWTALLDELLPPDAVLLLDNLEHLRGVPEAVEAILASSSGSTVLATSRTISGLDEEAEYALAPLPVAAARQVFSNVALQSGRPLPTTSPPSLIEQVCIRLDLLPLTIILAAAWSRLMTPQEILDRLGRSAELLRTMDVPGARPPSGEPRHATVASTVGWSLALVTESARAVFRALSAYPAPWPLDLVEAVCPAARLDPVRELVDAGLVGVSANDTGGTSYTMLQTVRDVGLSELSGDSSWHSEVLEHHAAHLLERARVLGPKLFIDEHRAVLVECDQIAPHVEGAFEYLIRSADWRAVSLAAAWWQYWFHRGQYRRGLAFISRALELGPASGDAPAGDLATALYGAAGLASYAGEHEQAARYADDSLARARALGDQRQIGSVISLIGMMELYAGHPETALDWYQRGLAEVDSESEGQTYATLLTNAAPVYSALGDTAAAQAAAREAARRHQAVGYLAGVAANLANLAEWADRTGDRDEARRLLVECRELLASVGDSYNFIQVILGLGKLSADEGDAATAQEQLDAARRQLEATDDPWGDAYRDALAAQIAVLNGDMTAAHNHAQMAMRKGQALGYQQAIVTATVADASAAAWSGATNRTLESARVGLLQSDQAGEATVVSLALLVVAAHVAGTSPAGIGEDVLALERLVRQYSSVRGWAPYPIAVRSALRCGVRLVQGVPEADRRPVAPIGELRGLALTLCDPESRQPVKVSTAPE